MALKSKKQITGHLWQDDNTYSKIAATLVNRTSKSHLLPVLSATRALRRVEQLKKKTKQTRKNLYEELSIAIKANSSNTR